MGMGIKGISSAFHLSRNTVRKYVRLFQESGIPMAKLMELSESRLQEMFAGGKEREVKPSQRRLELDALLPVYTNRLKRKGVTVESLYKEYKSLHPDGYQHAQFRDLFRRHRLQVTAVGHVEHYAGDQMYIDYAGDRLEIMDEQSGEARKVEVFVAILPCSHYTYCEAVWSQRKEDLIKACENALIFYGGAPMAIVPDNLRSAVSRSDRNEPIINDDFEAFAEHYGCAVYPARVRHPKDKALVENAVKLMYKSVYSDIEGLVFNNLEDLNEAILKSLEVFNNRKLTGRRQSRLQLFNEVEKDYLRALPANRFVMKERKSVTVMRNSYVTLMLHHYSVPVEYIGKRVEIVYDADTVEIYHDYRLVTVHQRDDTPYTHSTKEAHNLPGSRHDYEKNLEEVYERAAQIDNIVLLYLKEVAATRKYPPAAFKSCRGILSLEKKFGQDRLVAACACATQKRVYGYQEVLNILNHGEDAAFLPGSDNEEPPALPRHKNIRGSDYFKKSSNKKSDNNADK